MGCIKGVGILLLALFLLGSVLVVGPTLIVAAILVLTLFALIKVVMR